MDVQFDGFVLADMQTTNGTDTANLRFDELGNTSVSVFVDEETSRDAETGHTSELIGLIQLDGLVFG